MKVSVNMNLKRPPTGIDTLLNNGSLIQSFAQKKIAIITNQNMLTQNSQPVAYALWEKLGDAIKCILTPEHGWSGLIKEGVKVTNESDSILKLPILSLYGEEQKAIDFVLKENINTILIDLQDVGLRCYTYAASCAKVLEACAGHSIDFIVCDRSNPLGPEKRGPNLNSRYRSLVGYLDVPFQHGQTIGELLSMHNQKLKKEQVNLRIISCEQFHKPYQYPWVPPSPNLPSWDAALLYPALVLLEGTNISEGRGTSFPFTSLGAPGLDKDRLVDFLNGVEASGICARPIVFTPQTGKLRGKECHGVQILIEDYLQLNAFSLGISLLHFLKENYPNFEWERMSKKKESYFIDYLMGTDSLRYAINRGDSLSQILENFG